jgi:hypothetical protein
VKYVPRTKPFKHQSRATIAAVRQRNHAVFFEPRLGKSKVALDYSGVLALKGELRRVLVLAPRIALDVWASELHKHFPYNYNAETFTHEWADPSRGGATVNFFLAGREETMRAQRIRGKLQRPKQQILQQWRPDAIIIDESHEYKRPGGRGAQDCWRLVDRLRRERRKQPDNLPGDGRPYVLLLTGTPSAKGWRDLFAQFRIMDPTILGTNAGSFDEDYCVYGVGPRKYTVIRYRNLRRLRRLVAEHSSSCTAEQAGLAGVISFNVLRFDLPPRIREAYDDLAENFVTEVGGELVTAANVGVKRLRLLQITGGYLTSGRRLHGSKIDTAQAWLSVLAAQGEHAVVYARFTAEVDAAAEAAAKSGFAVRVIDGRTSRADRAEALRWFRVGRTAAPRALVFQYQAGSRSIELTTAAEVVFLSLPDGWVDFFQCLNRVRGPNQKKPVRITAICGRGTIDVSVLHALKNKEDMHGALMKQPRRFLFGQYHR